MSDTITASPRGRLWRALALTAVLAFGLVTGGVGYDLGGGATGAQAAVTRDAIAAKANAEVGNSESNGGCRRYGPCLDYDWCAMFVEWVWRNAGVDPVPSTWVATAVGQWGVDAGLFKARPSGSRGNPLPGDIAVYGQPGSGVGGHVSIVYSVNSNGTITTIDGNYSNAVTKRTVDPTTTRSGGRNVLISGYVTPPGVTTTPPASPVADYGTSALTYNNALRVFASGRDGSLWQYVWDGDHWIWQDLGGRITSAPSSVVHGSALRVFARGGDDSLWQNFWDGDNWAWQDLGGVITSPPSAVVANNALRVFARGANGTLWQNIWDGTRWTWQDLRFAITSGPSAIVYNGQLRVFARGSDGAMYQHIWNGTAWARQNLGGKITSAPSAVVHGSTLRVFARGADGALWQDFWDGDNWAWQDLGRPISNGPGATMHGSTLRVFARGNDGALWQNFWDGTRWTWQKVGGLIV